MSYCGQIWMLVLDKTSGISLSGLLDLLFVKDQLKKLIVTFSYHSFRVTCAEAFGRWLDSPCGKFSVFFFIVA